MWNFKFKVLNQYHVLFDPLEEKGCVYKAFKHLNFSEYDSNSSVMASWLADLATKVDSVNICFKVGLYTYFDKYWFGKPNLLVDGNHIYVVEMNISLQDFIYAGNELLGTQDFSVDSGNFLNRKSFLQKMKEESNVDLDVENLAKEFDNYKDFFFQPAKVETYIYGNDCKTPVKEHCAIERNIDKSKPLITIKYLLGAGWSTIVYYFQGVYEEKHILRKGTTCPYQFLSWLAYFKKNFAVQGGVGKEFVYVSGVKIRTIDVSLETAIVATNSKVTDHIDYPMEMYRTSRIDILKEKANFVLEEYTPEEILHHAKESKFLDRKFKNKEKIINLENVVVDVHIVREDVVKIDALVNFVHAKMKEQGIVTTSNIIWHDDLSTIRCQSPISFLMHNSNNIEMQALQLRELSRGYVILLFDIKNAWKYFEFGSKWHIYNHLMLLTLLFDCVQVSPIMQHYLCKYKFEKFKNNKAIGFSIRARILLEKEYDLNLFRIDKGKVWLNQKYSFNLTDIVKSIHERDLNEGKAFAMSNRFNYVKMLYLQTF